MYQIAKSDSSDSGSDDDDEDDSGESSGEDQTHEGDDESQDEDSEEEDSEDDQEDEDEEESIGFENTEQLSLFRSHLKIKVYGTDIPNPFRSFDGLAKQYKLEPYLERNILASGFKKPTPIQMQAIPIILHVRFATTFALFVSSASTRYTSIRY